ncbi:hypothetical protein Scep_014052 [Stephania cephalantha]|uniref:VOC domain-containing protein n=1 Tax=Stephania cephalantha TaxID=152367 RepID=A0AAP0J325_9MAGN
MEMDDPRGPASLAYLEEDNQCKQRARISTWTTHGNFTHVCRGGDFMQMAGTYVEVGDPCNLVQLMQTSRMSGTYVEDMAAVERKLKQFAIRYIKPTVGADDDDDDDDDGDESSGGSAVDQLFFNDPDGYMIEMCNCENLKLVPAGSAGRIKLPFDRHNPPIEINGRR